MKFSNVKVYNADKTMSLGQELALGMSPSAAWCPKELNLDKLAETMTIDRCVTNFMRGVDGCEFFPLSVSFVLVVTVSNILYRWPICCSKSGTFSKNC